MTTPAGWYPDPEGASGQRYWDGSSWTEHRHPAPPAAPQQPQPTEQSTAATPTPGAAESTAAQSVTPTPTFDEPTTRVTSSYNQPAAEAAPAHHAAPETSEQPSQAVPEYLSAPSAPAAPTFDEPTTRYSTSPPVVGSSAAGGEQPWASSTGQPPGGQQPFAGAPAKPADSHRKLVIGFASVVGVLAIVGVAIGVYAAFFHKPETKHYGLDGSETTSAAPKTGGGIGSTPTAAAPTTEATDAPTAAPSGGNVDGSMSFTVTGVETGDTITSEESEYLEVTAQGQYVVVHLTVQNIGPEAVTYLSSTQKLSAGGQLYDSDSAATYNLSELFQEIAPGDSAEVSVAFDIPVDATPESLELHGDTLGAGINVPL